MASEILALLKTEKVREELALVIPEELKTAEFISKATTLILSVPYLLECTPQSVLMGIKKAAISGLSLNGRDCHLVPFYDKKAGCKKAQFIVDAKGYIKLGLESGMQSITSDLVCERDTFRIWTDDAGRHLLHEVNVREPRGKVIGAYSYVQNASGRFDYEYMPLEEINAIKARSKASFGPWVTDENEMRRKTVIRRHSKRWPIGSNFLRAVEADDDKLPAIEPAPARAKIVLEPDPEPPALPEFAAAPEYVEGGDMEEGA
jgi:recombination protein RecT